jgi:hypothetical protein
MYFILSILPCSSVWSTTEPRKEDFLFFVFHSVSRVNTANMNAQPLHTHLFFLFQVLALYRPSQPPSPHSFQHFNSFYHCFCLPFPWFSVGTQWTWLFVHWKEHKTNTANHAERLEFFQHNNSYFAAASRLMRTHVSTANLLQFVISAELPACHPVLQCPVKLFRNCTDKDFKFARMGWLHLSIDSCVI